MDHILTYLIEGETMMITFKDSFKNLLLLQADSLLKEGEFLSYVPDNENAIPPDIFELMHAVVLVQGVMHVSILKSAGDICMHVQGLHFRDHLFDHRYDSIKLKEVSARVTQTLGGIYEKKKLFVSQAIS